MALSVAEFPEQIVALFTVTVGLETTEIVLVIELDPTDNSRGRQSRKTRCGMWRNGGRPRTHPLATRPGFAGVFDAAHEFAAGQATSIEIAFGSGDAGCAEAG